jgi:hypothetical protein
MYSDSQSLPSDVTVRETNTAATNRSMFSRRTLEYAASLSLSV